MARKKTRLTKLWPNSWHGRRLTSVCALLVLAGLTASAATPGVRVWAQHAVSSLQSPQPVAHKPLQLAQLDADTAGAVAVPPCPSDLGTQLSQIGGVVNDQLVNLYNATPDRAVRGGNCVQRFPEQCHHHAFNAPAVRRYYRQLEE